MFIGYDIIFVCSFFFSLANLIYLSCVWKHFNFQGNKAIENGVFVQWFSFKVWIWKLFVLLFFNLQSEAVGMKVGYVENRTIVRVLIVKRLYHFNEQKCSEQIFFENIVNSVSVWILNSNSVWIFLILNVFLNQILGFYQNRRYLDSFHKSAAATI